MTVKLTMGLHKALKIIEAPTLTGPLRLYNTTILMKASTNYNMGPTPSQRASPFPTPRGRTISGSKKSLTIMIILHHLLFTIKIVLQNRGFLLAKKIALTKTSTPGNNQNQTTRTTQKALSQKREK